MALGAIGLPAIKRRRPISCGGARHVRNIESWLNTLGSRIQRHGTRVLCRSSGRLPTMAITPTQFAKKTAQCEALKTRLVSVICLLGQQRSVGRTQSAECSAHTANGSEPYVHERRPSPGLELRGGS